MTIGDSVLDGYKQTASWLEQGTDWLGDFCEFYRERAAIERESSQKLAALTAKFHNKKANVSSSVSVGEHPLTTPGSLENHSLQMWMEMLNQTEVIATERKKLADELTKAISDEFALTRVKFEDLGKQFKKFNEEIVERRDKTYSHVKKTKANYDSSCETMESARAKGKKNSESKETEMYKCKNQYIIQVNIANRMKDKYYHDDVPQLLDAMQHTYEAQVAQVNRLLEMAVKHEQRRMRHCTQALETAKQEVDANLPELDIQMFIEHNANGFRWSDPNDFVFEPSPIWHDNDALYTQGNETIKVLRALLTDAYGKNDKSTQLSESRFETFETAKSSVLAAKFNEINAGNAVPLLKTEALSLQKLVDAESNRLETEVEIETIEAATAAVDMSHVPQTKLKQHRTIFGKKKEVVEVVDSSGGVKPHNRSLGLNSLLARTSLSKKASSSAPMAFALYNFAASGPGELSLQAGERLPVLEEDDGSGWVKVEQNGEEGIVPATYVEIQYNNDQGSQVNAAPPAPPPSRGTKAAAKETQVMALYEYVAADDSQLSINPQDVITVVEADSGSGWTVGTLNGRQGIFPTAYAQNIN